MRNKRFFLIPPSRPPHTAPLPPFVRHRCSTALINFLLRLRDGISQLSLVRSLVSSLFAFGDRMTRRDHSRLIAFTTGNTEHSALTQHYELFHAFESRSDRVSRGMRASTKGRRSKIWSADRLRSALMSPIHFQFLRRRRRE